MDFLPLFHHLEGRTVLLVGGGDIALRKARLLHAAGARIRAVAPCVHPELRTLAAELHERGYAEHDLLHAVLAVAATDDATLNAMVSAQAQARAVPVNVVDAPALCTVLFPAIVDRSPLVVAVGSGGHAPVLARLVRAKIETWLPARYGQLAQLARHFRSQVKARLPSVQQRRIFWEEAFQGPAAEAVFAGRPDQAGRLLETRLAGATAQAPGEVYWVDAGPGDPDLLTFRALRLMQQADLVMHDRTVPAAIVDLCRRDADRIAIDPQADPATVGRLAELAGQGKRALRLAAGNTPAARRHAARDALASLGVPCQMVPGVEAAPPPRPAPA